MNMGSGGVGGSVGQGPEGMAVADLEYGGSSSPSGLSGGGYGGPGAD